MPPTPELDRPILSVEDVTIEFGGLRAVDACSLSVDRGTITGLIGPNGAGKSTLFNLVTGFLRPGSGRIYFAGERIDGRPPYAIARLGLARTFQIPGELKQMTAMENLALVPAGQGGESLWRTWLRPGQVRRQEAEVRRRAVEVLDILRIAQLRDERAGNLSTGQKKLLELGRAFMADPSLILLDEPAAGVNPTLMRTLAEAIRRLGREFGVTFLIIEHDMDLVMTLCDPVIVMARGQTIAAGAPSDIQRDAQVLDAYLGGAVR